MAEISVAIARSGEAHAHSIGISTVLSLLPGIIGTAAAALTVPLLEKNGLPGELSFSIAGVPVLVLYYAGFLLYQSKKATGTYSIWKLIPYRQRVPAWQVALFVPLLIVWSYLVAGLFLPVDSFLKSTFFGWVPGWLGGVPQAGAYSPRQLAFLLPLYIGLNALLGPYLEELYYRGYLLPRIAWLGGWAPLLNAFLFYAHHPVVWAWISGTLVFLPVAYLTFRKKSLTIAIWYHILMNLISSIFLLGLVSVPGS